MDDAKRENNKIKRSKNDVKSVVSGYLQKRNYSQVNTIEITACQYISKCLLEKDAGRSNSVLYSCNSDPGIIDHNFTKFLVWLKDQVKHKNQCYDIELIVGPLFCHLYLDILRGGQSDKATAFLKSHLSAVDGDKCDETVKKLINLFATDSDSSKLKEKFRSKRVISELNPQTLMVFKKFVLESCHIVFLQVLQTWFEFISINDKENVMDDAMSSIDQPKDAKFQKILQVIKGLNKRQPSVYNIKIGNSKNNVSCGLMKRKCGLVAFAENNILCLCPTHPMNYILSPEHQCVQIRINKHSARIYSVAISSNNDILATVSADKSLCLYKLPELKLIRKCTGHVAPIYCVKISSNGEYIATGSMDNTARLLDTKTGKTLRIFSGHTQAVTCLDFHPNCLYIATGSADKNVRLWSISKGNPLRLLHTQKGGNIYAVVFNPSGRLLATATDDRKIKIWDLLTSKIFVELRCKDSPVIKIVWNTDGSELCTGTVKGVIRVWSLASIQKSHDSICCEPIINLSLDSSKLLSLEYSFGSYSTLTL